MELLVPVLKNNPLFDPFSEAELSGMLQFCERLVISKGTKIFSEGQADDFSVYFIQEGVVKITKDLEGNHKLLAMFGLGNIFGEMSFLDSEPRSATASADEELIVYKLTPEKFSDFAVQAPKTAMKMFRVFIAKLVKRLRDTGDALMTKTAKIIIS